MPSRTPRVSPGLPSEAEALYQAPLSEFVDARNALAARLRKAGDAAASTRVKALAKPSAPAWALNQVYWRARDDYGRMIAVGDHLRSLQGQMLAGRATDSREAMHERQVAVRAVVERALAFLAEAGQPATDATRQRINATADALATWGSHPQGYVPGHLDGELEPPGFDALASLGAPTLRLVKSEAGPPPGHKAATPRSGAQAGRAAPASPSHETTTATTARAAARTAHEAARAREAQRKQLARALHEAEREAGARRSAYERAAAVLSRATADAEAARKELAGLERQLATVQARADRAERARADAEASADAARRAHSDAEEAAARAKRVLDDA